MVERLGEVAYYQETMDGMSGGAKFLGKRQTLSVCVGGLGAWVGWQLVHRNERVLGRIGVLGGTRDMCASMQELECWGENMSKSVKGPGCCIG